MMTMNSKKLSFKDFVYYYKWYAIAALIIILLVAIFARECASTVKDDVVVNMLLSNEVPPEAGEEIVADLNTAGVIRDINEDGHCQAYVDVITVPYNISSEEDMTDSMRASLVLADEEAVLYFVDYDLLQMYEEKGFFRSLDDFQDVFGVRDGEVYIDSNGSVIGISMRGNAFFEHKGIPTENLFACFRVPSKGDKKYADKFEASGDVYMYIAGN